MKRFIKLMDTNQKYVNFNILKKDRLGLVNKIDVVYSYVGKYKDEEN